MIEELRQLFRSCRSLVPVLMVAGILAAHAQPPVVEPGARDFLEPNIPNPFGNVSKVTTLAFTIADRTKVELRVYDFYYNEVVTLLDTELPAGRYAIPFLPPPTLPSGMYFYELRTGRMRELRRMMYVK